MATKISTMNQTIEYVASDGTSAPANGATVTVSRAGASVRTSKSVPQTTSTWVSVKGVNTVRVGDTLQHDINSGVTMTVVAVERGVPRVQVSAAVAFTATAGERLIVIDSTVFLYLDDGGVNIDTDNVLTTNSLGKIQTFTPLHQVDLLISGSMFAADWISSDVQLPLKTHVTPRDFGAVGSGDELDIVQYAIDSVAAMNINMLHLDTLYQVNGTLTLPSGFSLIGNKYNSDGIFQLGAVGNTIASGGPGVRLQNVAIQGGGVGVTNISITHSNCVADRVVTGSAGVGIHINGVGAIGTSVRYSDISAITTGVHAQNVSNIRLEASDIEATAAGATALLLDANPSAMNGIYIGGHLNCIANGGGGARAVWSKGLVGSVIDLTLNGLFVSSGLVDLDFTEVVFAGIEVTNVNLDLDTYTSQASSGIINTNLSLVDSNGTPGGTPPTNTYPMRFDPVLNHLWIYNGTAWRKVTIGDTAADLEEASQYISTPGATTIATGGVYQKVAGIFTAVDSTTNMDVATSNRIKYTGATPKRFLVTMTFNITGGVSPADDAQFVFYKYDVGIATGAVVASSRVDENMSTATSTSVAIAATIDLDTNDYVELWVTRPSTQQVTLLRGTFLATEVGNS